MVALFLAFVGFSPAQAAPLLDPAVTYSVKKEIKVSAPSPRQLDNLYGEMKMDFQSFDPNDKSGQPLLSNQTEQLVKMRKLPVDPKNTQAKKDGLDHQMELTFEKLVTISTVKVDGLPKPFVTRSDLGIFLMNKPILVLGDGKISKKVVGLEEIRQKAMQEVKDPISRSTLLGLMKEEILLKTGTTTEHDSSCLGGLAKKNPGEKWNFAREEQGVKMDYACEFEGWGEAKGKKIAVIKVVSKKQRQRRQQPSGVPAMAETEGSGAVYFEPESGETMMKMETIIAVEPMEEELRRLKAKGQTVPRNRSKMLHWNRIYPILGNPL